MLPDPATNDVHGKALAINLDPTIYGTFAEIGAGQEVARRFLRVGAPGACWKRMPSQPCCWLSPR